MYTGGTNRLYQFIALTRIYSKAANRDPSVYGKEQLTRTQALGFPSAICKSFSGCLYASVQLHLFVKMFCFGGVASLSLRVKLCGQRFEGKKPANKPKFLNCSVCSLVTYSFHWLHAPPSSAFTRQDSEPVGILLLKKLQVSSSCTAHVLVAGRWVETTASNAETWLLLNVCFYTYGVCAFPIWIFFMEEECTSKNCSYSKWRLYFLSPKVSAKSLQLENSHCDLNLPEGFYFI